MKKFFLLIALVLGSATVQAANDPLLICQMSFKGSAKGFKIILGDYKYEGRGELNCFNSAKEKSTYPVQITMNAEPLSPQIAFGEMELNGQSMEFGLLDATPKSLFGEYIVAQAQGAIIGGVGVLTATKVGFPDLALKISLQFARGFGINLGVNTMHIKLIE